MSPSDITAAPCGTWILSPETPLVWSVAEHPSSPKVILIANCCLDSSMIRVSAFVVLDPGSLLEMPNLRSHPKPDSESILTSSPDG